MKNIAIGGGGGGLGALVTNKSNNGVHTVLIIIYGTLSRIVNYISPWPIRPDRLWKTRMKPTMIVNEIELAKTLY